MFYLDTPHTGYVFAIYSGQLLHVRHGGRVKDAGLFARMIDVSPQGSFLADELFDRADGTIRRDIPWEALPAEFPCYGSPDLGTPAFHAEYADGSTVTRLRYAGHRVSAGKRPLPGLPATYVEADTLEVDLRDAVTWLWVTLCYTAFRYFDAITRSVRVKNLERTPFS